MEQARHPVGRRTFLIGAVGTVVVGLVGCASNASSTTLPESTAARHESLHPTSTLAGHATSAREIEQPALFAQLKKVSEEYYAKRKSTHDFGPEELVALLKTGLEMFTGEEITNVIDWETFNILDDIFQGDQSDQIADALAQIQSQLTTITNQLVAVEKEISNEAEIQTLNSFFVNTQQTSLAAQTNVYLGAINNMNPSSGTVEQNRKNALIYAMGGTDPSVGHPLDQISAFDNAVLGYAEALLTEFATSSGTNNLFQISDSVALNTFKWEHQGYSQREGVQVQTIGLYTTAAALLQESLGARIAANIAWTKANPQEPPATTAVLESTYAALTGYNASSSPSPTAYTPEIQSMMTDLFVVERPDYQRYYQVSGHEMLLSSVGHQMTLPENATLTDFPCPKGQPTNNFWYSFYTLDDEWDDVLAVFVPLMTWYRAVYSDYNTPGATPITLYEILYGADEGNITPPAGADTSWYFVSSSAYTKRDAGFFNYEPTYYVYCGLLSAQDSSYMSNDYEDETQIAKCWDNADSPQISYMSADKAAKLMAVQPLAASASKKPTSPAEHK